MHMRLILLVTTLAATLAFSADAPKPSPVKIPGDKKAVEMDYGPYMAITVGVSKDNIAYKGILIPLNKEKTLNVLFDTELMRVAGVWSGGFLHWASRNYADNNNDFCTADGQIDFVTSPLPGWSHDGKREDPRKPKDGPLPKDWAKYKGLYLNGDQVVISYTVGDVPVLETYSGGLNDGETSILRSLEIGPSNRPMELFAFEGDDDNSARRGGLDPGPGYVSLDTPTVVTQAFVDDAPEGTVWLTQPPQDKHLKDKSTVQKTRAYLKIPPHDKAITLCIQLKKHILEKVHNLEMQLHGRGVDFPALTKGGPPRWTKEITTQGVLAKDDAPYVLDMLTAPEENPYKSWLRFTGLDFFPDGRAALCTWNGDVWIVSGIDEKLEHLKWKRFATGLNNPMGVKIVDGVIHAIGRDQITKLHDLNNSGEANFYENFNNDCFLTGNFHEMCFDLQTDKDGNFYYTKGSSIWAGEQRMTPHSGTLIKVSKDGSKLETICSGLRAPNGIGIGPNGEITVSDNQGNWLPSCPINLVKKDGYYGWVGSGQKADDFKTPDKPLCWIPYDKDKSTSGQVWVPNDDAKWGPFAGHMLLASYDCWLSMAFFDEVGGEAQGGVFRFPLKFASGMMRPRFNPADGQLYVAGLRGWSSSAARDCALQRVRYTGQPVVMPLNVHLSNTGLEISFTGALDAASVADKQNSSAEWFNVVRTSAYGSPDYAVSDPKKKGREAVEISDIKLKPDGKSITLFISNLKPVTNLVIKYNFKSATGAIVKGEVDYTINRMP